MTVHNLSDSENPNRSIREGFADAVVRMVDAVKDGDTVIVSRYKDALSLRTARNMIHPQLNLTVRTGEGGEFTL